MTLNTTFCAKNDHEHNFSLYKDIEHFYFLIIKFRSVFYFVITLDFLFHNDIEHNILF